MHLGFEERARLDADWSELGVNSSGQCFHLPWHMAMLGCGHGPLYDSLVRSVRKTTLRVSIHGICAVPNVEMRAGDSVESWSAALPVGVSVDPRARHVCMSITDDEWFRIAKSRNVECPHPNAVDLDCALMRLISDMWDSGEETWRRTAPDVIGPPVTRLVYGPCEVPSTETGALSILVFGASSKKSKGVLYVEGLANSAQGASGVGYASTKGQSHIERSGACVRVVTRWLQLVASRRSQA